MKAKKACPLAARIKKMLQADDDVGKIAQATPVMLARAMELFLQRLCEKAASIAQARSAKTITTGHLKQCVLSEETLDFLKEVVASAPDLPPEDADSRAAQKRKRHVLAAADSGTVSDPGGEATTVKRSRPRPRRSDPPAGGMLEDPPPDSASLQGQDMAMLGEAAGSDPGGMDQQGKGGQGNHTGKASPRTEQQGQQAAAECGRNSASPSAVPRHGQHDSAAPPSKRALGAQHMQGLDAPRLPPVHQEPEHKVGHPGNGSMGDDTLKRPRARGARSKTTQHVLVPATISEAATQPDVTSKSEGEGLQLEQHKLLLTPAPGTVTVAALASGVLNMIRNSTSRQNPTQEAAQAGANTDNVGAPAAHTSAGPVSLAGLATIESAPMQGITQPLPSEATADSQPPIPSGPGPGLADSTKQGGQILGTTSRPPPLLSASTTTQQPVSCAASTTTAGIGLEANAASKRPSKTGSSLRSSHPLAFRKAKPDLKKLDAPSDGATASAQPCSPAERLPPMAAGKALEGAVSPTSTSVAVAGNVSTAACRSEEGPLAGPGIVACTDAPTQNVLRTGQAEVMPGVGTHAPIAVAKQEEQPQLPIMPLLPSLAHLQAVSAQEYDDDYDNL